MRSNIKTTLAIALLVSLGFIAATFTVNSQQTEYSQSKDEAERLYAAGSYARANEVYSKIDKARLLPAEARWIDFRIADTLWRSQAGTGTADTTKFEKAQKQLEELIRAADKEDERDLVWAQAHESLGDFFWIRRDQMNWGLAWPHYEQALDWWAGQRDIDQARDRYLSICLSGRRAPNQPERVLLLHLLWKLSATDDS